MYHNLSPFDYICKNTKLRLANDGMCVCVCACDAILYIFPSHTNPLIFYACLFVTVFYVYIFIWFFVYYTRIFIWHFQKRSSSILNLMVWMFKGVFWFHIINNNRIICSRWHNSTIETVGPFRFHMKQWTALSTIVPIHPRIMLMPHLLWFCWNEKCKNN